MTSLPVSTSSSSSSSAAAHSPSLAPKQTAQEKALSEKLKKIAQKMLSGPPSAFASFTKPTASSLAMESSMADEVFAFGNARSSSLEEEFYLDASYIAQGKVEREKEGELSKLQGEVYQLLKKILFTSDTTQMEQIFESLTKIFHSLEEHNPLWLMSRVISAITDYGVTNIGVRMCGRDDTTIPYFFYSAVVLLNRGNVLRADALREAIKLALQKEDRDFLASITETPGLSLYLKFVSSANTLKHQEFNVAIENAIQVAVSSGKSEEYLALLATLKEQIEAGKQLSSSCLPLPA